MSLIWITNLSAPYRRPVWKSLSEKLPLVVGLLSYTEPNRRWSTDLPHGTARLPLTTLQADIRGRSIYALRRRALKGHVVRAVVLPGWEHPAAWQILIESKLHKIPTVAFYESTELSRHFSGGLVGAARRWFFCHVDSVLTVGEASRSAVERLGVPDNRIVTTRNSIDLDTFVPPPAGNADDDISRRTRFAYVGQLIARKNVETLLVALAQSPPSFSLDVVGEGPARDGLIRLAADLRISDRVIFLGYMEPSALRDRLSSASTLILPSTEEVYGLAPAEALALGLHAVVSDQAGIAADLAGMPGVWIVSPTANDLTVAMASSSLTWSGPVQSPPVREWTPSRFADDVLRAVEVAEARNPTR